MYTKKGEIIMPKHLESESELFKVDRKDIDAYHNGLMAAIHYVRSWSPANTELHEFLDHSGDLLLEPRDFEDFREIFTTALEKGIQAGLYQNYHEDQRKLKVIAKCWLSEPRTRYYSNLINSRLRCRSDEMVEPVSLLELEQRYQHYLYKRGRADQGLGNGPVFRTWVRTPNAKTFYDELNAMLPY